MFGPAALQGVDLGLQAGPGRFEAAHLSHDPVALGLGHLYRPTPGLLQYPLPVGFRLGPQKRALVLGFLEPGPGVAVGLGDLSTGFAGRLGQSLLGLSAGRFDD